MTLSAAFYALKDALAAVYDQDEANAVAHAALNHITGLSKIERLINKNDVLSNAQMELYARYSEALTKGTPLQYVIGEAWFFDRIFRVNEYVLIPRPETEELVSACLSVMEKAEPVRVLDAGTGSGCIAVSIKLERPQAVVSACDISEEALTMAHRNAEILDAAINFFPFDLTDSGAYAALPSFDLIVSNPPYIPHAFAAEMHINVKNFEPHKALFVPDERPLLFYECLADIALQRLTAYGYILCELHKDHAAQTQAMFVEKGFNDAVIIDDMHGNPRILKAQKRC